MARKQIDELQQFRALIARPRRRRRSMLGIVLNWAIGVLVVLCAYAAYLLIAGKPLPIEAWKPGSPSSVSASPAYAEITPGVSGRANVISSDDLAGFPSKASTSPRASESRSDLISGSRSYVAHFSLCHTGGGQNCVVDGDTAWIEGVKIRIADIDAPETHPPRCQSEAELGDRATLRMAELMNAGPFELGPINRDEDRYGRKLRIITRNGQSLGGVLVNEGLARWYGNGRRPWC